MPDQQPDQQQPEYISAYELAARKNVSDTIIYRKIKAGEIQTTLIGKTKYIDWHKVKDLHFAKAGRPRITNAAPAS